MNSNDVNFFLELESKVWAALASGDMKADESLLADDFLGVYSSGTADKADHASQLIDGPTIAEYELSEGRIMPLGEGSVLLTYLAHYRRRKKDEVGPREAMYITSIWRETSGEWLNIFSQDTETKPFKRY